MRDLDIPTIENAWLQTAFKLNRVQIFNVVIFKELLKQICSALAAKEIVSDMITKYEEACAEDIALEAAMTVFGKKKQLDAEKELEVRNSQMKTANRNKVDLFGDLPQLSSFGGHPDEPKQIIRNR